MILITIRTDKPEAEIGLYENKQQRAHISWQAHRQLAETIHTQIQTMLDKAHVDWADLNGIIAYKGPGSFTGLRIGISVANALAYSYGLPIVGTNNEDWLEQGVRDLEKSKGQTQITPFYGSDAHITIAKK
jgi:tRNA threonylcarbamoyladenosine biosynthesis protein TsaB